LTTLTIRAQQAEVLNHHRCWPRNNSSATKDAQSAEVFGTQGQLSNRRRIVSRGADHARTAQQAQCTVSRGAGHAMTAQQPDVHSQQRRAGYTVTAQQVKVRVGRHLPGPQDGGFPPRGFLWGRVHVMMVRCAAQQGRRCTPLQYDPHVSQSRAPSTRHRESHVRHVCDLMSGMFAISCLSRSQSHAHRDRNLTFAMFATLRLSYSQP
jgi:hypothetical protein